MRLQSLFIAALSMATPIAALADIIPPSVPTGLEAPAGSKAFLIGHAVGTQQYVCLPDGAVC